MTRKSILLIMTVLALTITGVLMITAQETDEPVTPPFGPGWMHNWDSETSGYGMGMMHGGFGMMWSDGEPMMVNVAEALGLDVEDLFTALHNGQTWAEIADAQGVELDTVHNAMLTEAEEHVGIMVEAGYITQEQADEHLTWMRDNIENMPMFSGNCPGYGMMQGNLRRDMMGRRGGMRWNN